MSVVAFQTRARTIDHLGRGQIADCPTAVSELWKNAYDAYAKKVALHIFDGSIPVAAITDDGHGMDYDEFLTKWLVVGTDAKAVLAKQAGADEVVVYTRDDFQAAARAFTGGKGVDVVYDSVGASTFMKSLDSLRPRGLMVTYGNASGPVPDLSPLKLAQKGSIFLTRPTLGHYAATRDELIWRSGDLFQWLQDGSLWLHVEKTYPMSDAAEAHRDLESRKTSGKLLLKN